MRDEAIRRHWEELASRHGTELAAATKTPTIKRLEIDALYRALEGLALPDGASILEVGCGNGKNCFALAELLPGCSFTGVDYVPEMVENAMTLRDCYAEPDRVRFEVVDALRLADATSLDVIYDVVFTDRCLINLPIAELQLAALDQIVAKTRPGGYVLLLENFVEGHARQNALRVDVGLPERRQAEYKLFIDDARLARHVQDRLEVVGVDDFGSLHDLVLYVLTPLVHDGVVDYDDPVVAAATELSLSASTELRDFGRFGQNRLYVLRRPPESSQRRLRTIALVARPAGLAALRDSLLTNPGIEVVAVMTHRLLPPSEDPARGERPEYAEFVELCERHGIPLLTADARSDARDLDALAQFEPFDLLCSVSWRYVLSPRALARPRVAALNLHRGALPQYAGAEPVRRMLEDGATQAVITAHLMVEEVDAGEVVARVEIPIERLPGETLEQRTDAVKRDLLEFYPRLLDDAIAVLAERAASVSRPA